MTAQQVVYALVVAFTLAFSPIHGLVSSSSTQIHDQQIRTLQAEMAALKNELKRDSRVRDRHTDLISKLEEMTKKQADVIKNLDVAISQQGLGANDFVRKSCQEIRSFNPSLPSAMYWIDPDGQGVGDGPIAAHCDMSTGTTSIPHDTESVMDMGNCRDPGCYTRQVTYKASLRQMAALIDLSSECRQSIRYDCVNAPLEFNGVAQSWWLDRNGVARYFWSGSNSSNHICQCGIDKSCIDISLKCNCDSMSPIPSADFGFITEKSMLPITALKFGRTLTPLASGRHTLGRLECSGSAAMDPTPSSCQSLWQLGHSLSGFYTIKGANGQLGTVFCDMTKTFGPEMQKWIGYVDVKSTPVYFYVQRYHNYAVKNTIIPFEVERLNIGGAMDLKTGVFSVPTAGVYFFTFSGLRGVDDKSSMQIHLQVNGQTVGTAYSAETGTVASERHVTVSLQSTLELKRGDKVSLFLHWGNLFYLANHFSGVLLQEHF